MTDEAAQARIDRLLDAIDLLNQDQRAEALRLLGQLIHEDNDFEDAWLWLSVAVESLDQSALCLDNVLRINPDNIQAASALHRIRKTEMLLEKRRVRVRFYHDLALGGMWVLTVLLLFGMLLVYTS